MTTECLILTLTKSNSNLNLKPNSMHSSAEHKDPTSAQDAAFVKVSVACTVSQHGSPLGMTGDADPMKGD
ncbi:hypothetical protein Q5P01_015930 [Channa striata]|uniref:Uncharacterized protein n=1 Tax=Channa striata TaxID=64152 RepID=A0AA88MFD7_CHASR|nr:hypothetical protein Q5P01_015930 [Channa striata]